MAELSRFSFPLAIGEAHLHSHPAAQFRNAYVIDVSQTEGKELPTIRVISRDVGWGPPYVSTVWRQQLALLGLDARPGSGTAADTQPGRAGDDAGAEIPSAHTGTTSAWTG
jgi:hypothetical protein